MIINKKHKNYIKKLNIKNISIINGGKTRAQSAYIALKSIKKSNFKNVIIHDAARPNFSLKLLKKLTDELKKNDCVIPAIQTADSIKQKTSNIVKNLKSGAFLGFAHGFNIHFKTIQPNDDINVIMIAPKGPGHLVRSTYLEGGGVPTLIAVDQDPSGTSKNLALSYASANGGGKAGVIETTFKEEAETDLFGEQADLCGGAASLIQNSFATLVNRGYQPEIAYFECLHELKLIVDLVQQYGIKGMYQRVSETARYGGLTRGTRVINQSSRDEMEKILDEIQSGEFAEEWRNIYNKEGKQSFDKYLDKIASHQIESTGKKLRDMMWPNETNE